MGLKDVIDQHDDEQKAKNQASMPDFKPFNFYVRPQMTARVMFISAEFERTEGRSVWGFLDNVKWVKDSPKLAILDELEKLEKEADEKYIIKHRLSNLGVASVIDVGNVTLDQISGEEKIAGYRSAKGDTVYLGMKRLFIGKLGTPDKPAAIRKILAKAKSKKELIKADSLAYSVWDIGRSGAKEDANGDSFEFIEMCPNEEAAVEHLTAYGIKPENIKLNVYPVEDALTTLEQVDLDLIEMKAQRRIDELKLTLEAMPEETAPTKPKERKKRTPR